MKRLVFVLSVIIMLLTMVPVAFATDEVNPISFNASTLMAARNLNQGGAIQYKGAIIGSSIFGTHDPSGFFAGLYSVLPVDGTCISCNFGTENNFYTGKRGRIGNVGYTLGIAYFDLFEIGGNAKDDLMQVFSEMNYHFVIGSHEVVPFARIEYVMPPPVRDPTFNPSLRGLFGVGYTFKLDEKISLGGKFWLIADDGKNFPGKNFPERAIIVQPELNIRYYMTKDMMLDFGALFSQPVTKTKYRGFEAVPSVRLTIDF